MLKIPFVVEMAAYCVTYHARNECAVCTPEGCPRLTAAGLILDKFRAERLERYRLRKRSL